MVPYGLGELEGALDVVCGDETFVGDFFDELPSGVQAEIVRGLKELEL